MPSDLPGPGRSRRVSASRPASSRAYPLRERVWTAGRLFLLAAALAATFGTFFLASMRVVSRARDTQVPDVVGRPVAEATTMLAEAGLAIRINEQRRPDKALPPDHVVGQDPPPGTAMRRQRSVRVHLSESTREPEVPAVTGNTERAAEISLAQEGITIAGRAEIRTSASGAGMVIAQTPAAAARASSVSLLVNRGEAATTYVMPDLIGTIAVRSAAVLRARGFRVAITGEVAYPGLPPGVVVRQSPQAGFQIAASEPISLEVTR
jgi:beta-lactam-binding protein with PASTA domain